MVSAIYAGVLGYVYNDTGRLIHASLVSSATVSAFVGALFASMAAYRLSPWHPLARYPGPIPAKLTKWYMSVWIAKGNRHLKLQELHRTYGSWVRIGPNELSVDDPAAIRPVYSQMFRAPFYQGAPQDADALITTIDKNEHAQRLVGWTKAFSAESIKNYRSSAQARTTQLLEILAQKKDTVSLSQWISLWAIDVMGDMSFSGGFETMAAGKDTEGWMDVQNDTEGGVPLSKLQAHADASFIVLAGSDTVSEAMTALVRYVTADAKIQEHLRSELAGAFDGPIEDMDYYTLSKLPYLDACVQEALRMVPPVAAGPPRWNKDTDTQILNHVIPAGTTVACPNYAMFHDPRNFVDPDSFRPERWLKEGLAGPHNTEAYVPFCYGPGVCIGKPVALYNMKLLTASVIRSFDLSFPKDFSLTKFDASYKEHNLWVHDELLVSLKAL
ncbi:hypothetical protein H0H81_000336 [Sphagnurus paluster]|uniref:Cytochrome P450 n=1 Tax=Sphagnurus paluster TaxID=117069 RepID=A0A9P7GMM1_9AGAR|nr:hypothetical protein H0H81_000336 [Sphagnurus paluster]